MIRIHLIIKGQVQGVFFRMNMQQEAKKMHITGWVKNLPNGDVEAILEGKEQDINKLLEWCHEGPAAATVKDIKTTHQEYKCEFEQFSIE